MRIFVTNQSGHNLDPAKEYGDEMIYITEGKVNIFKTDDLTVELKRKLEGFRKEDMLLFTGNSVLCALCLSILLTRHKIVKILIFNNKSLEYVLRQVDVDRLNMEVLI